MTRAAAVVASLLGACVGEGERVPLPVGDPVAFAARVQPVLDARCADPTCHGRPERPLAIYSATRYRRDGARTLLLEPLDDEETAANVRAMAALALDVYGTGAPIDDTIVLRKPLPIADGGAQHGGGVVFAGRDDRQWRALRSWLGSLRYDGWAPP